MPLSFYSHRLHWCITITVASLLCLNLCLSVYNGIEWQQPIPENDRIFWRTVFYCLAIVIMPLTNLIRFVFLRLNQTMPLLPAIKGIALESLASRRYALTISVTQLMMLLIGTLGGIAFYLGDALNTLYILSGVALLGGYFHRPKTHEYQTILDALNAQNNDD